VENSLIAIPMSDSVPLISSQYVSLSYARSKVEKATVPGRDLNRFVSVILGPFRDSSEGVMGRRVGCELSQKQARALDGSHAFSPFAADAAPSGELLCRSNDFGKKIPFVNCDAACAVSFLAMNFPKFDNWNF
jgi:hypothetical protein